MQAPERQTRSLLMNLFERSGFHPRSDLGQNFLIDLNLIEFLVEQADLDQRDVVLEIGAGTGGLTAFLAARAGAVISVEIDERVHALAARALTDLANVRLLHGDALRNKHHFSPDLLHAIETQVRAEPQRRLKLVANLPYSIATPVISNLVASDLPWESMLVTIQWELAERIRAKPASEHYGALSVWIQSQCDVEVLKKLGPTVFWPRPQVDSAIMRILPDPAQRGMIGDRTFFQEFVRRVFQQRRKSLRSVLAAMYREELGKSKVDDLLAPFQFKAGIRAEEIDVKTFVRLAGAMPERVNR